MNSRKKRKEKKSNPDTISMNDTKTKNKILLDHCKWLTKLILFFLLLHNEKCEIVINFCIEFYQLFHLSNIHTFFLIDLIIKYVPYTFRKTTG